LLALEKRENGERYILGSEDKSLKIILELISEIGLRKPPKINSTIFSGDSLPINEESKSVRRIIKYTVSGKH